LITFSLLGGLRFIIGENILLVNKSQMTINEIFEFLQTKSKDKNLIDPKNVLITINGTDSSVLGGKNAVIKDGDHVTLVTIVHGG
jgi:molybdopterin converting factor small subunit